MKKRKLKELAPGGEISLRLTKDIPPEVYDYLNVLREEGEGGNRKIREFLVDGVKAEMEPSDESVSVYVEGLTKEEKMRIEGNKEMMALIRTIIKASLAK